MSKETTYSLRTIVDSFVGVIFKLSVAAAVIFLVIGILFIIAKGWV